MGLVPFAARIDHARNIAGEIAPHANVRGIQINSAPRSEIEEREFILDAYVSSVWQLFKACNHDDRNRQCNAINYDFPIILLHRSFYFRRPAAIISVFRLFLPIYGEI